jgi:hypothetical protein
MLAACAGGSIGPSAAASDSAMPATPTAAQSAVESAASTATPAPVDSPAPEPTDSLGAFSCNQPASGVGSVSRAQITDVRVGTHDGYDRIVFEFDDGIPAYTVEPATPPFTADASGLPIDVAGSAFLHISLNGGTRVGPDGTLTYSGATSFEPGFDELAQLIEGGDFEAVSTWYAGLATEPCIRVFTLADPARLIVDIQH